jgi:hypothetical protein
MNPVLEGWLFYFGIAGALGVWALILMYLERRDSRTRPR